MIRKMTKAEADQSRKFVEKARELGADDDDAAFERKLKRIVKAGPQEPPPKKKKTPEK